MTESKCEKISNNTSNERSCFAAQIHTTTDMIEIKIKGTNTSIHQ